MARNGHRIFPCKSQVLFFKTNIIFFPKPRFFPPQKPPSFSLNSGFSTKPRFVFPQNPGFFSHNPTLKHTPQAILSRAHRSSPSDVQDGGSSRRRLMHFAFDYEVNEWQNYDEQVLPLYISEIKYYWLWNEGKVIDFRRRIKLCSLMRGFDM